MRRICLRFRIFVSTTHAINILSFVIFLLTAGIVVHAGVDEFVSESIVIVADGTSHSYQHIGQNMLLLSFFLALALSSLSYSVSAKLKVEDYIKWGSLSISGPISIAVLMFYACYSAGSLYIESAKTEKIFKSLQKERREIDRKKEHVESVYNIIGTIPLIAPSKARFKIDCIGQNISLDGLKVSSKDYNPERREVGIFIDATRPLRWKIHNDRNDVFAEYEMEYSSVVEEDRIYIPKSAPIYNVTMHFNGRMIAQICPPYDQPDATPSGRVKNLPEIN